MSILNLVGEKKHISFLPFILLTLVKFLCSILWNKGIYDILKSKKRKKKKFNFSWYLQ
jgi:hypothetical protein